jgi:hypothetical protein
LIELSMLRVYGQWEVQGEKRAAKPTCDGDEIDRDGAEALATRQRDCSGRYGWSDGKHRRKEEPTIGRALRQNRRNNAEGRNDEAARQRADDEPAHNRRPKQYFVRCVWRSDSQANRQGGYPAC